MLELIGGLLIMWLIIKIGRDRGWTGSSPIE